MKRMMVEKPVVLPASKARFVLALWLCGLTGVLYLDRICMAQAIVPMQKDLNLSNTQLSWIGIAFSLAYGLFEIPSGRWGDRFGSRLVLTRIVLWWSAFTALTGVCTGFYSLFLVRFLFGAGEAGAFPNAARVITRWFPTNERGRVQGFMLAAAQMGAVLAPAATAQLIERIGWQGSFFVFGAMGIVWALGFWWWFRDDPGMHPSVNAKELAHLRDGETSTAEVVHAPIPWKEALTNRGILTLCAIMILGAFYTYLIYVWFPKYLQNARGVDNIKAGYLTSLVIGGSALGMLLGGWLADRIPHWTGDAIRGRRYLAMGCYLFAAVFLFTGTRLDDPLMFSIAWGLSFFSMHITLPNWWLIAMPQCGAHVGSLSGLMNGIGFIGAMGSQWFVGFYTDSRKAAGYLGRDQWDPMFDVYAGVLVLGAIAWWSYRYTPLNDPHPAGPKGPTGGSPAGPESAADILETSTLG